MPDAPRKITSPQYAREEAERAARSPLYWCHNSCTVYQYHNMSRAEQERIQSECRAIEQAKRSQQ